MSVRVEIDVALLEFMQRYANTLLKWDIVTLFGENPHIRDVAANIAMRLSRSQPAVARELEDLMLLGLLRRARLPSGAVYQLTDDPELRQNLARFVRDYRRPYNAAGLLQNQPRAR